MTYHEHQVTKSDGWHLDQKVPIGIIVALLLQTAGMVWWAAKIDAASTLTAQRVERVEFRVQDMESNRADILVIREQLSNLNERFKLIQEDVRVLAASERKARQNQNQQ